MLAAKWQFYSLHFVPKRYSAEEATVTAQTTSLKIRIPVQRAASYSTGLL
jgi:hypothetical protein